jgi:hypothetical protein
MEKLKSCWTLERAFFDILKSNSGFENRSLRAASKVWPVEGPHNIPLTSFLMTSTLPVESFDTGTTPHDIASIKAYDVASKELFSTKTRAP